MKNVGNTNQAGLIVGKKIVASGKDRHIGRYALIALGLLVGGALAGCATEAMQRRQQIEQRIAIANSPADHEALAAWFDQEAKEAEKSAVRHRDMGNHYVQWAAAAQPNLQTNDPAASRDTWGRGFWERCDNLVRLYTQAAEENHGLAKLHRQMAAGAKP